MSTSIRPDATDLPPTQSIDVSWALDPSLQST